MTIERSRRLDDTPIKGAMIKVSKTDLIEKETNSEGIAVFAELSGTK